MNDNSSKSEAQLDYQRELAQLIQELRIDGDQVPRDQQTRIVHEFIRSRAHPEIVAAQGEMNEEHSGAKFDMWQDYAWSRYWLLANSIRRERDALLHLRTHVFDKYGPIPELPPHLDFDMLPTICWALMVIAAVAVVIALAN